jgi:hypothetical protein
MSTSSFSISRRFQGNKFLSTNESLLLRPYYKIAFIDQPMMKLIGGIPAIGFADLPYLLVFVGTLFFAVQLHLNRTLHVLTELSSFVVYIPFD